MNILIYSAVFRPTITGAGEMSVDIGKALISLGHSVEIVTNTSNHNGGKPENVGGIVVTRLAGIGSGSLNKLFQTLALLILLVRSRKKDVRLLINGPDRLSGLVVIVARAVKIPVSVWLTLSGSDDPETLASPFFSSTMGGIPNFIFKKISLLIPKANWILCHSNDLLSAVREAEGWGNANLRFIPATVDVESFSPGLLNERTNIRVEFQVRGDTVVYLFCGWLTIRKGIDILLDAWLKFARNSSRRVELWLVGKLHDDDVETQMVWDGLIDNIRNEQEFSTIRFIGEVKAENIVDYYRNSDVFVFPTRREGFPKVVVEAMSCGLPLILPDRPEIFGNVLEEGNGVTVFDPPESSDSLAESMSLLLENGGTREKLGTEAMATCRERFSSVYSAEVLLESLTD